jgi:hypothetical protein
MLNVIGYDGPISVEWEDAGMDREIGAPEALEYLRKLDWPLPGGPSTPHLQTEQEDATDG